MAKPRLIGAILVSFLLIPHISLALGAPGRFSALTEVEVNDEVAGDVVALAGDVLLGPEAEVHGHVVAVFGKVQRAPGAQVDGRVIAVSSLGGLQLADSNETGAARLQAALRFLTAGVWLFATTLIALLWPGRIRFGVWLVPSIGAKMLVLGVLMAITLFAALVAVVGLGPTLGVPLFGALAVAFLLVRAFGLAVLGAVVGSRLLHRVTSRSVPITAHVFIGVAVMLAARFLPFVGSVIWTCLTVAALGTALFTVALAPDRSAVRTAGSTGSPRH
jgi:hypothetical protein